MKRKFLPLFGVLLLVGLFFAPAFAKAANMNEYFNESYSNNNPNSFTTNNTLKIIATQVSESQVVFKIQVLPVNLTSTSDRPAADSTGKKLKGFTYTGNTNENSASPSGRIDTESDLGYWDSLYDETLNGAGSGTGLKLDFTKSSDVAVGCQEGGANFYNESCYTAGNAQSPIDLVHYLLKNDDTGKMRILGNGPTFYVQFNGLTPDTDYSARLRIKEDATFITGSSKVITFRTNAASTGTLSTTQNLNESGGDSDSNVDEETQLPSCGVFGENSSIMGCVGQIIYYVIFKPTSFIMALTGEIMDWGLGYTIDSNSYSSSETFVSSGWKITRDIANMLFIFILLYIAIATILDIQGVNPGRMIGMVILVALLINFSLFFTRVIVDAGNIGARLFYSKIVVKNSSTQNDIIGTGGYTSVSYAFADKFNPTKLFSAVQVGGGVTDTNGNTLNAGLSESQFAGFFAIFSFVGAIINLVAAFMFFSIAWMFIARTGGLWIAMIFAPIAFLSLALPQKASGVLKKLSFGTWSMSLMQMAFMPIAVVLMFYLIIQFLNSDLIHLDNNQSTTGQFMAVIIPLALIVFLLQLTKKTATDLAGEFGEQAAKVGSFIGGTAVGLATGGVALAGRGLIGRAGAAMQDNGKLKDMEKNGGMMGRAYAKSMRNIGNSLSQKSYDVRAVKVGGKSLQDSGLKVGEAKGQGGFVQMREDQRKKEEERAEKLKVTPNEKEQQNVYANQATVTRVLVENEDEIENRKNNIKKKEEELEEKRKDAADKKEEYELVKQHAGAAVGTAERTAHDTAKTAMEAARTVVNTKKAEVATSKDNLKLLRETLGLADRRGAPRDVNGKLINPADAGAETKLKEAEQALAKKNRERVSGAADRLDANSIGKEAMEAFGKSLGKGIGVGTVVGTAAAAAGGAFVGAGLTTVGAVGVSAAAKQALSYSKVTSQQAAYNARKGIKIDSGEKKK